MRGTPAGGCDRRRVGLQRRRQPSPRSPSTRRRTRPRWARPSWSPTTECCMPQSPTTGPPVAAWPADWMPLAMNAPSQARPTIVDATLGIGIPRAAFVSSQDGSVYCVNADTGQVLWTSPLLGDAVQAEPVGIFRAYGELRPGRRRRPQLDRRQQALRSQALERHDRVGVRQRPGCAGRRWARHRHRQLRRVDRVRQPGARLLHRAARAAAEAKTRFGVSRSPTPAWRRSGRARSATSTGRPFPTTVASTSGRTAARSMGACRDDGRRGVGGAHHAWRRAGQVVRLPGRRTAWS